MRFMMIVKASKDSEAGVLPRRELIEQMGKFNQELTKAGALLAAEGLHASSKGARVIFSGDKRSLDRGKIDLLAVNLGLNSSNEFTGQRDIPCRVPDFD